MLLRELLIFGVFFFLQQFLFSVIGNLLYHDVPSYATLSAALLTIFKASAGVFNNEELVTAQKGDTSDYIFILTYMIFCYILIVNLIVGQLSAAYKRYVKTRSVLMLLETLSVREASEADLQLKEDKYSAAVSCPYPLSILNLALGTYVLTAKSPYHNTLVLHFYYVPTMLATLILFIAYQLLILPLSYVKIVCHKFALVVKAP